MSAKVLVTGASGYLAGHVVQQLQAEGHAVRGTVRSLQNEAKVKHLYDLCPTAKHRLELVEADLTKPETWAKAVEGMDYVIHTASPFPLQPPKKEEELIRPAVDGTLAVLKACSKTPSVKRVVLTSSCAAIDFGGGAKPSDPPRVCTENDWTNADNKKTGAYIKSKTLAEKAAWNFVRDIAASDNQFELAVINPSFILGPSLKGSPCTSVEIIKMLMEGQVPGAPRVQFSCVDVRDVAAAHVKAMTVREAAGNRHILATRSLWFRDIARLLDCVFGPQGYKIPTGNMAKILLWFGSFFDAGAQQMYDMLDIKHQYDNRRMRQVLCIEPRDVRDSIIEMAHCCIDAGQIKKTSKYKGPGGHEERQKYMAVEMET